MNGLSELNSFTQTPLTYTDDRDPKVTFDRGTPTNQTKNIGTGQSHTIMIGIEIIDIIKPDSLNIYIDINVSAVAGATVTVPSLNPTLTLANISSGVYRISNIDTLADWANVKTALINIPAGYQNNYNYTCTINYDPSKTKSWTTAVNVGVISLPAGTFSLTASLTGNATSVINMSSSFGISALVGRRQQSTVSITSTATEIVSARKTARTSAGLYALATMPSAILSLYRKQTSANLSSTFGITISPVAQFVSASSQSTSATMTANANLAFTLTSVGTQGIDSWNIGRWTGSSDRLFRAENYVVNGEWSESDPSDPLFGSNSGRVNVIYGTAYGGYVISSASPDWTSSGSNQRFGYSTAVALNATRYAVSDQYSLYIYRPTRTAKTITNSGNVNVSDKHWIEFDGSGDYLSVPSNTDFVFSNDFTIEMFVYRNNTSGVQYLLDMRNSSGTGGAPILFFNDGTLSFGNGTSTIVSAASGISTGTWAHVAVARSGSQIKLFVNGSQIGSTATNSSSFTQAGVKIAANYDNIANFNGWLKEIRLSNTARYTSTFTARSASDRLMSDVNTVLLINPGYRLAADDTIIDNVYETEVKFNSSGVGTIYDMSMDGLNLIYKNSVYSNRSLSGWSLDTGTIAGNDKKLSYDTNWIISYNSASTLFLYNRTSSTWNYHSTVSLSLAETNLGISFRDMVAINSSGTRIAVAVNYSSLNGHSNVGAVRIYARSGSSYSLEQELFQEGGLANSTNFGTNIYWYGNIIEIRYGSLIDTADSVQEYIEIQS